MRASTLRQWVIDLNKTGELCSEGYRAAMTALADKRQVTLGDIARFVLKTDYFVPDGLSIPFPEEPLPASPSDLDEVLPYWDTPCIVELKTARTNVSCPSKMRVHMPHKARVKVRADGVMPWGVCLVVGDGGSKATICSGETRVFEVPPNGLTLTVTSGASDER